jgi:hypothetical protein
METERVLGKEKREVPVTSYTFSSIIMYIPFSASLCSDTWAGVNDFDIFVFFSVCLLSSTLYRVILYLSLGFWS